ncbi:hypothetical protein FKM82_025390 [Ascaphus truei]
MLQAQYSQLLLLMSTPGLEPADFGVPAQAIDTTLKLFLEFDKNISEREPLLAAHAQTIHKPFSVSSVAKPVGVPLSPKNGQTISLSLPAKEEAATLPNPELTSLSSVPEVISVLTPASQAYASPTVNPCSPQVSVSSLAPENESCLPSFPKPKILSCFRGFFCINPC